ncbi:DUF1304 domain-containing protein [Agromyces seonyuensis]|uniref:DUF1304 family protein n=1 Tax=Agromyces seonyuensis TaxID=2662446 RepID=A0A6I4NW66_9MICO|nr:DUF1304 domain-containing protein [Agromyces seonyuensis]MWB98570.1 DUF1304 family protein [Agromyces seonyuensis]
MLIAATVFVALAALLHCVIFYWESIAWTRPATWKRFGVPDQAAADATKSMAYNQGFYNLFLAIGAVLGLVVYFTGSTGIGTALVLFSTGCMVLAAAVLTTTGKGYWRPALVQGVFPLVGFVLFALV